MDKILRIWCFGLLAISFVIYNGVTVRFVYPKIFFMQTWLGLGLLLFSIKVSKERVLSLGNISLSFLTLLLISLISSSYSPDLMVSFFGPFWRGTGLLFYLSSFLCFMLLKEFFKEDRNQFAKGVIYSGWAIASIVFLHFLFTFNIRSSVYLVIGNVNPLSFWLGVTVLLSYLYRELFKDKKWIPILFSAISLFLILLLGSRGAIGGLAISGLIIGLSKGKKTLKICLGLFGLVLVVLLGQYFIVDKSVLSDILYRTKSFNRMGIWQGAFDSFLEKPIGGYGFHGLIQGYWENYTSYLDKGHAWNENAHSLILNMAGELGSIGLIALSVITFYTLKRIHKLEDRIVWYSIFFYIVLYCLSQPFFVDTVFLLLFVYYLLGEESKVKISSDNFYYRFGKVIFGVVILAITFEQFTQVGILNETRRQIAKHGNYRKVWKTLEEKEPFIDHVGAFFEINTLLINNFAHVKPGETDMDRELRTRSKRFIKESLESLMKKYSHRPRLLRTYGLTLIQENELEKAEQVIDLILSKSDQVTEMYYYKAVIYAKLRKNREAKEMLLKVKKLNPDYKGIDAQLEKLKNY